MASTAFSTKKSICVAKTEEYKYFLYVNTSIYVYFYAC